MNEVHQRDHTSDNKPRCHSALKPSKFKKKRNIFITFKVFEFLLPKDALYQVWLKLAHWFLRRRFLNNDSKVMLSMRINHHLLLSRNRHRVIHRHHTTASSQHSHRTIAALCHRHRITSGILKILILLTN